MPAPASIPRLYAIADAAALGPTSIADAVGTMIEVGIEWIQVRAKDVLADREMFDQVERCVEMKNGTGVRIWVNDRADVATLAAVDGLHLGQYDMSPAMARDLVGETMWIGQSTHNENQARAAHHNPDVDVVAVGPIFSTTNKENAEPVLGLEKLRRIRDLTDKPLVAIGGITAETIAEVLGTGADSAVLLGDLCSGDLEMNCMRAIAVAGSRS